MVNYQLVYRELNGDKRTLPRCSDLLFDADFAGFCKNELGFDYREQFYIEPIESTK